VIAYKFLAVGSVAPFTGFRWPVGEWVETGSVDPCRDGIHACSIRDLPIWIDAELWEIELDGEIVEQTRKLVAPRGRLGRRLEEWSPALLREFGLACLKRTRERVGFLPILSGYVVDVDKLVAEGRVPLGAFAAARAAELRDGPAGYERERRAQSTWLAERLGLEHPDLA
jgi:hypothetical protein